MGNVVNNKTEETKQNADHDQKEPSFGSVNVSQGAAKGAPSKQQSFAIDTIEVQSSVIPSLIFRFIILCMSVVIINSTELFNKEKQEKLSS